MKPNGEVRLDVPVLPDVEPALDWPLAVEEEPEPVDEPVLLVPPDVLDAPVPPDVLVLEEVSVLPDVPALGADELLVPAF